MRTGLRISGHWWRTPTFQGTFKWLLKSNSFKRLGVYCINVINLGQASEQGCDALTGGSYINFIHPTLLLSPSSFSPRSSTYAVRFYDIYVSDKIEIQISSSDGDLRKTRFVRGIWIWQLVILDDSFDYLSARYARNVGDGFLSVPLRSFPFSGRTPNGSDTLTSMDYFSVRRIMRLPHWRFRVEVLRMNAYTCNVTSLHTLRRRDYVLLFRIAWLYSSCL